MQIVIPCKHKSKKAEVASLILDQANIRTRKIFRNKKGHYIITEGSILSEDITILNKCAPNNRVSKCMRQTLIELNGEIDKSTFIVGDFTTTNKQAKTQEGQIYSLEQHY